MMGPPVGAEAANVRIDEGTRRQIRGSSLLLLGRFLSVGLNGATQVVVVRHLSKADYGAFAYALSLVGFVQILAGLGLDKSISRFLAIYDEERDYGRLWGALTLAVGTIASLGVAVMLLLYGIRGPVEGRLLGDERVLSLLLVLIVLAPIQALDGVLMGAFAVFSKARAIFFRRHVLAPLLRLTAVVVLVIVKGDVFFLAAGYVVAGAVGVGIFSVILIRTLREQGLLNNFSLQTVSVPVRALLGFTLPLLVLDLLFVVMQTSDAVLLEHFRGSAEVASFRVIGEAAVLNTLVMSSFTLLFIPLASRLFARGDKQGVADLYWQTAAWIAVLSFPIFALTFSFSKQLTVALYGSRYEESATFLALLAIAYYFNAALGFNGLTLRIFGKVRYIVVISVLAAVVNLLLNFFLIRAYGALGAALGTSATIVAHNILKQLGLRLGTGIAVFDARYVRMYLIIVLAATGLLAVGYWAPQTPLTFGFAAAASLFVVGVNRKSLAITETFPELSSISLVRRFF